MRDRNKVVERIAAKSAKIRYTKNVFMECLICISSLSMWMFEEVEEFLATEGGWEVWLMKVLT